MKTSLLIAALVSMSQVSFADPVKPMRGTLQLPTEGLAQYEKYCPLMVIEFQLPYCADLDEPSAVVAQILNVVDGEELSIEGSYVNVPQARHEIFKITGIHLVDANTGAIGKKVYGR